MQRLEIYSFLNSLISERRTDSALNGSGDSIRTFPNGEGSVHIVCKYGAARSVLNDASFIQPDIAGAISVVSDAFKSDFSVLGEFMRQNPISMNGEAHGTCRRAFLEHYSRTISRLSGSFPSVAKNCFETFCQTELSAQNRYADERLCGCGDRGGPHRGGRDISRPGGLVRKFCLHLRICSFAGPAAKKSRAGRERIDQVSGRRAERDSFHLYSAGPRSADRRAQLRLAQFRATSGRRPRQRRLRRLMRSSFSLRHRPSTISAVSRPKIRHSAARPSRREIK